MTEIEKPFGVPDRWTWSTFEEIGEWNGGGTPSKRKTSYWEGDIPWVSPKDMKRLQISDTQDHVTEKAISESATKMIPKDSILFVTRSGILEHSLPTARARVDVTINQDLKALSLDEHLDPQFVLYYTCAVESQILRACSKDGTTVASLQSSKLYNYPIPVPPLSEQRRIVEKIEELFSNLDTGVANLETAQTQMERYRLSVLQSAVEGRLTADWRRTRDPEPADQLLERILEERREYWEKTYRWERYDSKSKTPPSGWKSRFKTFEHPDGSDLPDLPETWTYAQMRQIGEVQLGRQRAPKYHDGENMVPYLRVANVYEGRIDTEDVKEMHFSERDYQKYKLKQGDILLNEGQSLELVGRPAMYRGTPPDACFQNTLIRFRGYPSLNREYALMVFRAYMHTGQFADVARQTTSVAHLGSTRFSKMAFPLPPLSEQQIIVDEAARLLSVADNTTDSVDREQARAERMRQSILKEAFQGQLVWDDAAARTAVAGVGKLPEVYGESGVREGAGGQLRFRFRN